MKYLLLATALFALPSVGYAGESCSANAANKHLSGAAKSSFMTKCQRDVTAMCESNAQERKLSGAAKTSFTKKCVNDAVGS